MTESEKQAIETIKEKVFNYNLNKKMGIEDKMTEQGRKEGKALETVLNLIENKDKIIDEMAKFIYELYKSRPMTIDKAFNHNCYLWEDCDDINWEVNCDYCIKEYFKKKVNGSEQE